MVRDEQQWIELLVELERDVLGLARSERGAWPCTVGPLGNLEEPGDETVHRSANESLSGCGREKRAADVVGVARPNKWQDLVVGDDRHRVSAGSRRRAVERVRDAATDLVGPVVLQIQTRPHRSPGTDLIRGETSTFLRNGAGFGERRL